MSGKTQSTQTQQIKEYTGISAAAIPEELLTSTEPLIFRGLADDWPLVNKAKLSHQDADNYLREFYQNLVVTTFSAAPELGGRFFYNDDLTDVNFTRGADTLTNVLDKLRAHSQHEQPESLYVGSTTVDTCLPGFRQYNDLALGDRDPLATIWIGNRSVIAAHYDLPDNIACVAAGRRRFTLFPPEQLANLYVGPIDFTPAGQAISLVDFHRPDFTRFPRFRDALKASLVADLQPGDAIFIPSMWWHHVEALEDFNVLINYWWRQSPAYMGPPQTVLHHAILALRDLPPQQKKAWQGIFEHYIFDNNDETLAHIPEHSRGSLGQLTDLSARKLRALLLNKLNR